MYICFHTWADMYVCIYVCMHVFNYTNMEKCKYIYLCRQTCMNLYVCMYMHVHISHSWDTPLNNYACHTTHACHTTPLLQSAYTPNITAHTSQNFRYLGITIYVICTINKYAHTWDNYVSLYTIYEFTVINSMTKNTDIHKNIPPELYMHVALFCYCSP